MRTNHLIPIFASALTLSFSLAGCPEPGLCTPGEEACACHEDACFDGLSCRSGVCVDLAGDESSANDEGTGDPPTSQPTLDPDPTSPHPEPVGTTSGEPGEDDGTDDSYGSYDPGYVDADGDGWSADLDCDDYDPSTFPLYEGKGSEWASTLILSSATICPGTYRHASIEIYGDDLLVSGYDVTLDGDGYDFTEMGYFFPMIYLHDSTDVGVEGFRVENFRGYMTALYAGDCGTVSLANIRVSDFVQAAYGPSFGTIYVTLVQSFYVENSWVEGAMGRITLLGNGVNEVYGTVVAQTAAAYPEPASEPMPAALHVGGYAGDAGFVGPGETIVSGNQLSVVDGTSAIYLRDGLDGGSISNNEIACGFSAPQYGIASDGDYNKLIAANSIDGCWDGIAGFGTSAGNEIHANVISNYSNNCILFDTVNNVVGSNTCI